MMNKNTIEETIIQHVKPFTKNAREGKLKNLSVTVNNSKPQYRKKLNREYCPYCGLETTLIWVHSHYQCQKCKNVVLSCCGDK